ncbi:MAG TPA: phenylalanine--tRNA ligase subunit alpha [Candidatus Bathyarchaeia archaeon]|nr:phenylalanine--tRNA ligase subunit alpha [Candidatus Bathyarchaeia archaeon]
MIQKKIREIKSKFVSEIMNTASERELYDIKVAYLGRKGKLTEILKSLKELGESERKVIGPLANETRHEMENMLAAQKHEFSARIDWETEKIDATLPGEKVELGHLNPITLVQRDIEKIFSSMGFEIADGPEIETEWYNFDALNIPENHPARDSWDTFWIKSPEKSKGKLALRPHTSPVQIRYMQKHKPPFRIIAPGKCFRHEATDATHEHTFHQFEALMVGDSINVGNFKSIAKQFFSAFFEMNIDVRIRPSFFPFTEPSFEFDISCTVCAGKGCKSCKGSGWLEIGGAGMVNQNVFVAAGYSRNKYQGFAWGFGLERLAMMKYKIDDIRLFHGGDLRFVKQF